MFGRKILLVICGLLATTHAFVWYFAPGWFAQATEGSGELPAIRFQHDEFEPQRVLNPFDPIVDPPHVDVEQAKQSLQPNELVLGIELDGHARAYPINMLTGPRREIFNDALGDRRIAATW